MSQVRRAFLRNRTYSQAAARDVEVKERELELSAADARADRRLKERELEHGRKRLIVEAVGALALVAGLLFTWWQFDSARDEALAQQRQATQQLELAREGQITDRFSRAIDQLGTASAVDVQIGGIYALRRIARDSASDRQTVGEVLSAFVVRSAPGDPRSDDADFSDGPFNTMPAVRVALAVLGDLYEPGTATDFDLRRANLQGAELRNSNFSGANLAGADLRGADFTDGDLRGAVITGPAGLAFATLVDTDMRGADLGGAYFDDANVARADLRNSTLGGSALRNVRNSADAAWRGACVTADTTLPPGMLAADEGMASC